MPANKAASASLTRRATLKGVGVAVGTLWVAPVVQVISMESAAAASSPPARVQSGGSSVVAAGRSSADTALPKTGSETSVALAAAGVGAVAVGAVAVVAAHKGRPGAAQPDTDGADA